MDTRPIGIYDSGSGGLSVWQAVTSFLPHESTIYIGDHRFMPYSTKTKRFILDRADRCMRFLLSSNAKIIVVACNTATVAGIDDFRKHFPHTPIIGVVPVVKTAAARSKTKKFGVLATEFTAKSAYQRNLIKTFAPDCDVYSLGNTELVARIEKGQRNTPRVRTILRTLLNPAVSRGMDVLVLGCTHFPFLRSTIAAVIGDGVLILDSGAAVARHVEHILEHENMLASVSTPSHRFFTTGNPTDVSAVVSNLLGRRIVVEDASYFVQ